MGYAHNIHFVGVRCQGQQRTKRTISQLQDELRKALDGASTAKAKLVRQERETLEAEARYVSRLERRSKELRELWEIHYPRIDFSQQPVRWSAEQDFKGRIEIERALKELAEADDPVTLSRSKNARYSRTPLKVHDPKWC
jgi:hypothetical protein